MSTVRETRYLPTTVTRDEEIDSGGTSALALLVGAILLGALLYFAAANNWFGAFTDQPSNPSTTIENTIQVPTPSTGNPTNPTTNPGTVQTP